jgi:hypothetical protein
MMIELGLIAAVGGTFGAKRPGACAPYVSETLPTSRISRQSSSHSIFG